MQKMAAHSLEDRIIAHLSQTGSLTGGELVEAFDENGLTLWQTCLRSTDLITTRIGRRYLRLDRRVEGYARLSPSIFREFISYSVVGLSTDAEATSKRAAEWAAHIERISRNKLELAQGLASGLGEQCAKQVGNAPQMCFILGGDIVYKMANDAPRPEQSTGKLVRGSDIDLVVVLEDTASDEFVRRLDGLIYSEKCRVLTSPAYKEEIDYVIKRMSRVREQLRFDTLKHMIACKILAEGILLYGSESLFMGIKTLLREHGIPARLGDLERRAQAFRKNAEEYLLHADPSTIKGDSLSLFYPAEESEELE